MHITYDPQYNIAYIQLREKQDGIETLKISDEINIDIASDGKVYGIELLNANDQLDIMKSPALTFLNEQTRHQVEIPITV